MRNNNFLKNKEKGVSLIITFFILTIILAVVLSISMLLYGQIKIIRNIGNSVIAFYAADSGVEKFLYYDRKQLPVIVIEEEEIVGERGLCYIGDICSDCTPGINGDPGDCVEADCHNWSATGNDCDPLTCTDCVISFETFFNGKSYDVEVSTTIIDEFPNTSVDSRGVYKEVSRKIQLQVEGESSQTTGPQAPTVIATCLSSRSIPEGTELTIYAEVTDPDGVDSVVAHVQYPDGTDIGSPVELTPSENIYSGDWVGDLIGFYYVDIVSCDTKMNCNITNNIINMCSP